MKFLLTITHFGGETSKFPYEETSKARAQKWARVKISGRELYSWSLSVQKRSGNWSFLCGDAPVVNGAEANRAPVSEIGRNKLGIVTLRISEFEKSRKTELKSMKGEIPDPVYRDEESQLWEFYRNNV